MGVPQPDAATCALTPAGVGASVPVKPYPARKLSRPAA